MTLLRSVKVEYFQKLMDGLWLKPGGYLCSQQFNKLRVHELVIVRDAKDNDLLAGGFFRELPPVSVIGYQLSVIGCREIGTGLRSRLRLRGGFAICDLRVEDRRRKTEDGRPETEA
jgi:hypothetical protein